YLPLENRSPVSLSPLDGPSPDPLDPSVPQRQPGRRMCQTARKRKFHKIRTIRVQLRLPGPPISSFVPFCGHCGTGTSGCFASLGSEEMGNPFLTGAFQVGSRLEVLPVAGVHIL